MSPRVPLAGALLLLASTSCGDVDATELPVADLEGVEPLVARAVGRALDEVGRDRRSGTAWGELGEVYEFHGFLVEAGTCYARAAELDPAEWRWPYHQGGLARTTDMEGAMVHFARAAELRPDHAPLQFFLGWGALLAGDADGAEAHFERARDLDRELVNARLGLARTALLRGDLDRALAELRAAEALAPEDAAVQRHFAQVWRARGDEARAAEADGRAERARKAPRAGGFTTMSDPVRDELGPRLGAGLAWRAMRSRGLLRAGRGEEALAEWEALLAEDPASVPALLESVRILDLLGRLGEARGRLDRAISLDPSDVELRCDRARLLDRLGEPEQALAELRHAHELAPSNPRITTDLASALLATGDVADALQLLLEASELEPEDPDLQYYLAAALVSSGRGPEALPVLQGVLRSDPRHPRASRLLAVQYARGGEGERAATEFLRAVELDPTNVDLRLELGRSLWLLERYPEAIAAFRAALREAPGSASAERELAWALATCPRDGLRDGAQALAIARELCDTTGGESARDLDILAAARAETGDFDGAVASESEGIALLERELSGAVDRAGTDGGAEALATFRGRLALYRRGVPFRDGPPH